MDFATIFGLLLGFGAVVGGQILEGGHVQAILQPTAALIVLGGTFGATFVSFPHEVALKAFKDARCAFFPPKVAPEQLIAVLTDLAAKRRRNGLISLEKDGQNLGDPFLRRGIAMIVDGVDPQELRENLEVELATFEAHARTSAEYFEAAGGFAPTIGIIGAVLGLIHVMENLSDPSKLGAGIAVAFVATIYGLVTANIICLPISTKLKHQLKKQLREKELILEGLLGIVHGQSPRLIEQRLLAFLHDPPLPCRE